MLQQGNHRGHKSNSKSNSIRTKQYGFSLFELIVVFILIGVLAAIAMGYYARIKKEAEVAAITASARQFAAVASGLHAQWFVNRVGGKTTGSVMLENQLINMNEFGWPANSNTQTSPLSFNQTAEECMQLWNAFSQFVVAASTEGKSERGSERYHVSAPESAVCRYELALPNEGSHYFDYNLRTGAVKVSAPVLKTGND